MKKITILFFTQFKTHKNTSHIIGAAALLALIFSCSAVVDIKILDLNKVDDGFNPGAFYKNKIAQTNKTIKTDPAKMDKKDLMKKLDENLFVKDTLCFYTSSAFGGKYIDSKSDYSNRNKPHEGIYGFNYRTISWNENDSLAVLNGVYFQRLDMLEQKDGRLITIKATNESKSNSNYGKLVAHLKKKYGAATTLLQDKAKNLEILNWETATNKIQLRTQIDTVEDVLSTENGVKKEVKLETKYTIDYFRVNKTYLPDLEKIKTGEWYLTKDN